MSLFEVPGWSVPSAPVPQGNKKRKRPTAKDSVDIDEAERMHSAQKNIETLMKSLGAGMDALDGEDAGPPFKRKRDGKEKKRKDVERGQGQKEARDRKTGRGEKTETLQRDDRKEQKKRKTGDAATPADRQEDKSGPSSAKSKKKKQKQQRAQSADGHPDADSVHQDASASSVVNASISHISSDQGAKGKRRHGHDGLTALQVKMKGSLDGARFRWINEMLYKSDSGKAREVMSQDPVVFADYHTGFRHQVESWPTNPVSHYTSVLSSYPAKTTIADLGCGDATLARALTPKRMSVLSFDLVSDGAYVIEADICSRVPLPGSEPLLSGSGGEGEGEGQVVDVVVCALSLMGTNWPSCIREAWRILRPGGELKIAEVTSRLTSVDEFTSLVSLFGFKLKSKDERNSHFALFEFKKVPRKPKSEKDWERLLSRGSILKPCEYKRR